MLTICQQLIYAPPIPSRPNHLTLKHLQFAAFLNGHYAPPYEAGVLWSQHPLQFRQSAGDVGLQSAQIGHDFGGGRIGHRDVVHLLVFVDGEVVALGDDFRFGHEEALLGAPAVGLPLGVVEAGDEVGDVVLRHRVALVVQREAVGLHVVEPDVIGAAGAGFDEDEHGGGDARVGLEDARGHGDDGPEPVVFHEFLADGRVGLGGAEEDAIGHDAGASAALLQHPQEEGEEEELRLFGVGDGFQVVMDALGVDGALEGGIGEADGVAVADVVLFGDAVLIGDLRVADGVEHQVHGGEAQHGAVGVEPGEHGAGEVRPLLGGHGGLAAFADIFRRRDEEARGAAGGIADGILRHGAQQLHHHLADVLGGAELAVLPGGGELAEHVFVEIALHVQVGDVVLIEIVQPGDDLLEHLGRGDQEHGVGHIAGEGGVGLIAGDGRRGLQHLALLRDVGQAAMPHVLDGGKDPAGDHIVNGPGIAMLEAAPAHCLPRGGSGEDLGDAAPGGVLESLRLQLLFVQRADEHQIGQLLDHRERIGDAACPEIRPDFVHFVFDCTGNHTVSPWSPFFKTGPRLRHTLRPPGPCGKYTKEEGER